MSFYRELTALRANSPALRKGKTAFAAPDKDVFAIVRSDGKNAYITAVSRASLRISIKPEDLAGESIPGFETQSFDIEKNGIRQFGL